MKMILKRILICCLAAVIFSSISLIADRNKLTDGLIRFHVVAHSDSEQDQKIKETVKNKVLYSLQEDLVKISDIQEAKKYLTENLPKIQLIAQTTLYNLGFQGKAVATLSKEVFDVRHYDTFSLPGGVYDSLRIVIGDGMGQNWWCVSFPTLCIPATAEGFEEAALCAGFSETLTQTLSDRESHQIRFYFLDQLGKLQNYFFQE